MSPRSGNGAPGAGAACGRSAADGAPHDDPDGLPWWVSVVQPRTPGEAARAEQAFRASRRRRLAGEWGRQTWRTTGRYDAAAARWRDVLLFVIAALAIIEIAATRGARS